MLEHGHLITIKNGYVFLSCAFSMIDKQVIKTLSTLILSILSTLSNSIF